MKKKPGISRNKTSYIKLNRNTGSRNDKGRLDTEVTKTRILKTMLLMKSWPKFLAGKWKV